MRWVISPFMLGKYLRIYISQRSNFSRIITIDHDIGYSRTRYFDVPTVQETHRFALVCVCVWEQKNTHVPHMSPKSQPKLPQCSHPRPNLFGFAGTKQKAAGVTPGKQGFPGETIGMVRKPIIMAPCC